MGFRLGRGVNISHWLSQSERRGAERRGYFDEADVERIAAFGFDHVRLPVDEVQLWDEQGRRDSEGFELLERGLGWFERAGLRVVVDLHIVRSHYFNASVRPLFGDPAEQKRFCELWAGLSEALGHWSVEQVAYELLNEPVAENDEEWNSLAARALAEVRAREPERMVAVGSNRFSEPLAFSGLRVPEDERLILTFHFYDPILFTHYRAYWNAVQAYEGPIDYPGELVSQEVFDSFPAEARNAARNLRAFRAEDVERLLDPALALARKTGLPLWCGEFGALDTTPPPARERWYRDVLAALDRHQIPWTVWDNKGDFGVFDAEGRPTLVHRFLSEAISSS
ncbi:MAG: cellulase family glycosylhydrolase [Gaiellaceae bacterium]